MTQTNENSNTNKNNNSDFKEYGYEPISSSKLDSADDLPLVNGLKSIC